MPRDLTVSIIVCTRNRCTELQQTLETIGRGSVPSGWQVEVIVVDNASTDGTSIAVSRTRLADAALHYLYEPKPGLSNARNAGLAKARGEIILFTDDDVLVDKDWIEQLASPLADGKYDAVTGQIAMATHLDRPWMTSTHRIWLAANHNTPSSDSPADLIGANMGFHRSVLEHVPAFDPELGAGALGSAEETLFGWQLRQAGLKIAHVPTARVVHQFDVSRLRRDSWLDHAVKRGRTNAYLQYHWEHVDIRFPSLVWFSYQARLQLRSCLRRHLPPESEGCPPWEMSYIANMALCKQFGLERRRPRNYPPRGLRKRPQKI
jgi:glucosyl-dolichyl phosphate glucuronosyltransferase